MYLYSKENLLLIALINSVFSMLAVLVNADVCNDIIFPFFVPSS